MMAAERDTSLLPALFTIERPPNRESISAHILYQGAGTRQRTYFKPQAVEELGACNHSRFTIWVRCAGSF